ncbi:MAG: DeoR family transcriptional regulator [Candidatus Pacebacteria bacterium]|nr:DeoR family transcriptional regulator [Candidatus Paceibacterota bacterium]
MFERSHIIKLTVVLYKVSNFFPVNEPIKCAIREKANEILANLILAEKGKNSSLKAVNEIEVLLAYLQIAKAQKWAKEQDVVALEEKYNGLKNLLEESFKNKKAAVEVSLGSIRTKAEKDQEVVLGKKRLNDIVDLLKKRDEIQVKDLKEVFPNLSKRTLRRDFEYLLSRGVVERVGDNNTTVYKLKNR